MTAPAAHRGCTNCAKFTALLPEPPSYSKETILEAYLNTISHGYHSGCTDWQPASTLIRISQLTLWSITLPLRPLPRTRPTTTLYQPLKTLIHRRNFLLYNMWQQGVISEDVSQANQRSYARKEYTVYCFEILWIGPCCYHRWFSESQHSLFVTLLIS